MRDIERWFADQQSHSTRQADACRRKRWFASEAEARAAALWDRTQFAVQLSAYRCGECDGWHLTRASGR